jgi:hypothetical protein
MWKELKHGSKESLETCASPSNYGENSLSFALQEKPPLPSSLEFDGRASGRVGRGIVRTNLGLNY